MARCYRRLSPADEDEIWVRLRAGHAAKPTAREFGVVDRDGAGLSGAVRWDSTGSSASLGGSVEPC
jgi:hypothetical protein